MPEFSGNIVKHDHANISTYSAISHIVSHQSACTKAMTAFFPSVSHVKRHTE